MIRILEEKIMDGEHRYIEACGLSTDAKPSGNLITGSTMLEVDTQDVYFWDESSSQWRKAGD